MLRVLAVIALLFPAAAAAQIELRQPPPPRTFPQFVGTWILDEAASTGRLTTPMAPLTMWIATTPTELTLTKQLRAPAPSSPLTEIYRFDGTPTTRDAGANGITYTFSLVSDALVLTQKRTRLNNKAATFDTYALSVDGDVLTLNVQLVSVSPEGYIYTMQEPSNNFRHTFIYRRQR